jgi:hypothetical protein
MPNSRPSGLGMTFLVGGVLFAIVVMVICFVPMAECPFLAADLAEKFRGSYSPGLTRNEMRDLFVEIGWEKGCPICRGSGRVPLLGKWISRNAPAR